jgi:outer membrane lipoprotein-sorting protein
MKIILLFISLFFAVQSTADNVDYKLIDLANGYLRKLSHNIIAFEQFDSSGISTSGTLVISKPDFFRCDYKDSYPLLIVGNKDTLYIYDFELEQYSTDKINHSVFLLLTQKDLAAIQNIKIVATRQNPDSFIVELFDNDSMQNIKLNFANIHGLNNIEIIEANGNDIDIVFVKNMPVKSFNKDLFIIPNPLIFGKPKRLSFEDIKNKSTP